MARLTLAEKALIALAYAFEDAEAKTRCRHERWEYLIDHHAKTIGEALGAAVHAKIKRDNGKCDFCGGDARKCYPRHANGRSCN
jgi:hypothetical protein